MKKLITIWLLCMSIAAYGQLDTLNVGTTANDGTGEGLRPGMLKVNQAIHKLNNATYSMYYLTSEDETDARSSAWWDANTLYVLRDTVDLDGNVIELPVNVTITTIGGVLKNGTLQGNYSSFYSEGNKQLFDTAINFTGNWNTNIIYPEYFGAKSNDSTNVFENDISPILRACVNTPFKIVINPGNYYFASTIELWKPTSIHMAGHVNTETVYLAWRDTSLNREIGTRLYTDQSITCFDIKSQFTNIIGGGLLDYTNVTALDSFAAIRYDLNRILETNILDIRIKGGMSLSTPTDYKMIGVLIDGTNLTTYGYLAWNKFDIKCYQMNVAFYVTDYEPDTLLTWINENTVNIDVFFCRHAMIIKSGGTWYINGTNQPQPHYLSTDDKALPVIEMHAHTSIIDFASWDQEHVNFCWDYSNNNRYVGKSNIVQRNYRNSNVVFKNKELERTHETIRNPMNFTLHRHGADYTAGISHLNNAFAYYLLTNPTGVTIKALNGNGFDFDTNLTPALSLPVDTGISISDTANFFRLRGALPTITFTEETSSDSGFVEIAMNLFFKPRFLSYNIYGRGGFQRIQTIIYNATDTIVSNIYPTDNSIWSRRIFTPFTETELNLYWPTKLIIRFIGTHRIDSAIEISDIFAGNMTNPSPVIDIGGGQTIYGSIRQTQISAALTDGAPTDAEIDAATGLTPSTAGAGWRRTIKDSNGTGLLYKIESDGTNWFYTVMTKAL